MIAAFVGLVFAIPAGAATDRGTVEAQVRSILSAYAKGDFREPSTVASESGWELVLPSGRTVTRSFLQAQAEPLVALGRDAIEPLIRWVGSAPDAASRYIAIYALERLTGRRPAIGYQSTPDPATLERAAREWRRGGKPSP